jgi:prepilin-type N-terminal cleavage/methylation domain-containing protein
MKYNTNYSMNRKKGFTLIELLMVISIISLLSSIIIPALNDSKKRARFASGQAFSSHNDQALGAEATGWWDFEEIVGNKVLDKSGNGFHGTLVGGSTLTDGAKGKALTFGNGKYVNIGAVPVFKANESFTISAWVNLTAYDTIYGFNILFQDTYKAGGVSFGVRGSSDGGNYKKFGYWADGMTPTAFYSNQVVPLNEWHHILMTWDKTTKKTRLYYDGVDKGGQNNVNSFTPLSSQPLYIGYGNNTGYFNGKIDEVRIYGQALEVSQIQELYAEGATIHSIAINQ